MNKNTFDDAATWNTFTEAVASEWLALNRVAALLSNALALHAVARLAVAAMGRREITPFERSTYDELLDALRRIETQLSERNAALSAAQTAPPDDLNRQMERLGAEYKQMIASLDTALREARVQDRD